MIRENQKYLNRFQVFLDMGLIPSSFLLAYLIRFYILDNASFSLSFMELFTPILLATPVYLFFYTMFDLYSTRRTKAFRSELGAIVKTNVLVLLLLTLALFSLKVINFSRATLIMFFVLNTSGTIALRLSIRILLKNFRAKGHNLKHCLVVGTTSSSMTFIEKAKKNPSWGYHIVGVLKDYPQRFIPTDTAYLAEVATSLSPSLSYIEQEPLPSIKLDLIREGNHPVVTETFLDHKVLGSIEDLDHLLNVKKLNIDIVIIGVTGYDLIELKQILYACEKAGVKTNIIPYYHQYIPAKPYMDDLDGLPVIDTRHVPLDNVFKAVGKRMFDIIFSLTVILLLSPLYLFTALMVKLSSPGPILFKQERVGLNRKFFNMYKFRSMRIQTKEEEKSKWTTKNDPRKTRWGSFMRKTSIDELPQFFNVLKGDMSVVGPRPERPYFVEKFKEDIPRYMIKHQVRPGITGWAQVSGYRGDTSIEGRIEHDLYYIENWSFTFDLKIILLTITKGFINKNAY
jgi:Undecaprenyl-phosphate glucose phosphotransferase